MDESKRKRIADDLRTASNHKFLRGGRARSLRMLEHAWADAVDLPHPWRALCAYRLAHVLMRDATRSDLQRADELFSDAARAQCLGPWPQLYRVAVIARLGEEEQTQPALNRAKSALEAWRAEKRASAEGDTPREARLQDDVFNLLELACYFVGGNYDALEGLGERAGGLDAESYRVVTSDPRSASVACTQDFAREEMDARAKTAPDAILFELTRDEDARWRRPGSKWEPVDHRSIRLLACVGAGLAKDERQLRDCVYGDSDQEKQAKASVRQIKFRLGKALGLPPGKLLLQREGVLRLDVPVIGVVHWSTLNSPPDPPPVTRQSHRSS